MEVHGFEYDVLGLCKRLPIGTSLPLESRLVGIMLDEELVKEKKRKTYQEVVDNMATVAEELKQHLKPLVWGQLLSEGMAKLMSTTRQTR